MIKVVLFDADGVLINQERFSDALAREYGISTELTKPFFKGPFQECMIGNADLKEVISPYLEEWGWTKGVDAILDYWFERENNLDLELVAYVQELRKRGIQCILATDQEKRRFAYFIGKLGFAGSFDKAFCAANLGNKKPEQDFFRKILKDLNNIKKEEILFWDDDIENIEAAKNFGINAEVYTNFENFREKMKEYSL